MTVMIDVMIQLARLAHIIKCMCDNIRTNFWLARLVCKLQECDSRIVSGSHVGSICLVLHFFH